jgi:hypothetical protein
MHLLDAWELGFQEQVRVADLRYFRLWREFRDRAGGWGADGSLLDEVSCCWPGRLRGLAGEGLLITI